MRQDYIMKVVEQIVQALLSIRQRRQAGEHKEARAQVQVAMRYLVRTDVDLLLLYGNEQIFDHFKDSVNCLETEKCVLGADLLHELALIEEAEQQLPAALRLKELCLYLYTLALPQEAQFHQVEYFERVSQLVQELQGQALSEKTIASVRAYEDFFKSTKLFETTKEADPS